MRSVIANWPIIFLRGVLAAALAVFAYFAQGFSKIDLIEMLSLAFLVFALCTYGSDGS